MSKGSPVVQIRMPKGLLQEMDGVIDRSYETRLAAPWTRSSFIVSAVIEKLKKMERSRKGKRKGADQADQAGNDYKDSPENASG